MGLHFTKRLILLSLILGATGAFAHLGSLNSQAPAGKPADLGQYLSEVPGWEQNPLPGLSNNLFNALELDDYVNSAYSAVDGKVFLYIGQYHSPSKVGAAHDPLVCFPGQGWKVSDRSSGKIFVWVPSGEKAVSYAMMTAALGESRQLILYWFQAADSTHSNTFQQKLSSFWNALFDQGRMNAFIRISTSLQGRSEAEAKQLLFDFVRDFYPLYLEYIYQNLHLN